MQSNEKSSLYRRWLAIAGSHDVHDRVKVSRAFREIGDLTYYSLNYEERAQRLADAGIEPPDLIEPKPTTNTELEFMECDTCRKKPGTPVLCDGCLHNRRVILDLRKRLRL